MAREVAAEVMLGCDINSKGSFSPELPGVEVCLGEAVMCNKARISFGTSPPDPASELQLFPNLSAGSRISIS
jgi:hypothetical protein